TEAASPIDQPAACRRRNDSSGLGATVGMQGGPTERRRSPPRYRSRSRSAHGLGRFASQITHIAIPQLAKPARAINQDPARIAVERRKAPHPTIRSPATTWLG